MPAHRTARPATSSGGHAPGRHAPGGTARTRTGDEPLPSVLVAASGASRCGTTLASAILAVAASSLGRDVLLVDATRSGTLLPLVGAHDAAAAVSPTLTAAAADVSALFPLLEAPPAAAGAAVLVDAGARLGTVLGALAAALAAGLAPGLLVVTGTDAAQLAAAYALIKVAAERGLTTATEVVVVGGDAAEARDAFALLTAGVRRFLDRPLALAAHVPEDPSLAVALAAGMSVHDAAAGSPAAAALAALAERWAGAPAAAPVTDAAAAPSRHAPTTARAAAPRPAAPATRRPAVPGLSGPLAFAAAPAR
ncbi:hypothetical protein tb265_17490 [Gemmatimonadetes bacterium T265]|nr:hypothetical protein tb265_17490 [Gemmatimonadetes bacterium T265]